MAKKSIDYAAMTKKYSADVNVEAVHAIVNHCGIALRSRDARYIAASDRDELARIARGFCAKKLGLDAETASNAVSAVALKMKATRLKHRVPFYYLIAEHTGRLESLAGGHDSTSAPAGKVSAHSDRDVTESHASAIAAAPAAASASPPKPSTCARRSGFRS